MGEINNNNKPQEQLDFEFLKIAVKRNGFFTLYFKELPNFRTCIECFNSLNDRYFDLIGEYRYSGWHSFRRRLKENS